GRGDLDGEVEGRLRDLVQDLFLGAEVEVQRRRAEAGLGCDVPRSGGGETPLGDRGGRGQQDAPGTSREVILPEEPLDGGGGPGGGRGGLGSGGGVRVWLPPWGR